MKEATFGNGCFWCTEAVFSRLEGVVSVRPGYAGGHVSNPTYKEVCADTTGHAEVIRIVFDPEKIAFESLLEVFWETHDPTTRDRQGNDVGSQYRSVIFYHNEQQKRAAIDFREKLEISKIWNDPIVTEISQLANYYDAENYHQDYYAGHKDEPYCAYVIAPKIEKIRKIFADRLKPNEKPSHH